MAMWNWFNCYLSGRHDYGMWCEPGAIFCVASTAVDARQAGPFPAKSRWSNTLKRSRPQSQPAPTPSRVIPFKPLRRELVRAAEIPRG